MTTVDNGTAVSLTDVLDAAARGWLYFSPAYGTAVPELAVIMRPDRDGRAQPLLFVTAQALQAEADGLLCERQRTGQNRRWRPTKAGREALRAHRKAARHG